VLQRIVTGEVVGTLFLAQGGTLASRKRWIGFTAQPRGTLVLDDGARRAIEHQGRSLLPIGVRDASGEFQKGDIVALVDLMGHEFARGLTNYTAAEVLKIKGLRTEQITSLLGYLPYAELVHRDNMTVTAGEP
jgi:glutamate 5-kinase